MKYILIFLLASPLATMAQFGSNAELNLPDHDERLIHFGINVGANRSHYNFSFHPRFLTLPNGGVNDTVTVVESLNSTGINLAWLVNLNLGPHWDIRTYPLDLVFTEKAFQYNLTYPDKPAGESNVTTKKIQGITLALPVQLKFSSDRIANFKVYMMAGGKVEYDFAASKAAKGNEELIKLKKLDYGVETGIGFHLYFPVFVLTPELKLSYGLNNVHLRDNDLKYSNVIDKVNSRTITFSLTVE
jgi:hypothetical protein